MAKSNPKGTYSTLFHFHIPVDEGDHDIRFEKFVTKGIVFDNHNFLTSKETLFDYTLYVCYLKRALQAEEIVYLSHYFFRRRKQSWDIARCRRSTESSD